MIMGIFEILVVLVVSISGTPIAVALGFVGIVSAWVYYGGLSGAYLAGVTTWYQACSWQLTTIPLFIFMGELVAFAGLGKDAFDCLNRWVGRIRGGLAIAANLSCALFGCICGSTTATIATIGSISIPEMKKHGYSVSLRTGCIACAGILANLIPPSINAVVYCVITETSIGKVLMAGLIPGIILTIMYSVTIWVYATLRPKVAPVSNESFTFKSKVQSIGGVVPIIVIFLMMVGGIYTGVFSPTEAAGMGAALSLMSVLILRRMRWKAYVEATRETVRVTTFIMFLILRG